MNGGAQLLDIFAAFCSEVFEELHQAILLTPLIDRQSSTDQDIHISNFAGALAHGSEILQQTFDVPAGIELEGNERGFECSYAGSQIMDGIRAGPLRILSGKFCNPASRLLNSSNIE